MITLLLILVLSLVCNGVIFGRLMHDPFRDIAAPARYAVDIPNLTFDSRGFA